MDEFLDFLAEHGPWSVGCAFLALILFFMGHGFVALMLAVAALTLSPHLRATFDRYGIPATGRKNATAVSLVIAVAALIFADSDKEIAESSEPQRLAENQGSKSLTPKEAVTGPTPNDSGFIFGCNAVDGDTLKCGNERIRLLGMDTPEMPGHCAQGRACVPGDPFAAKESLSAIIEPSMEIVRLGSDRYGRTIAVVYSNGVNLSCWQIINGHGFYTPEYDLDGLIAGQCAI